MKQTYFEIGQIVNTFGIHGFVKVKPFTDDMDRFQELQSVLVEKNKKLIPMKIEEVKYQKNVVLLKLKNVDNINTAEEYRGCYLKIKREQARKLPKDTYFIADLLGMDVYTDTNQLLGKLDDIYNNGNHDIYVVKNELGKQILLPNTKEVIKQVDLDNEKIVVHLLEGLI